MNDGKMTEQLTDRSLSSFRLSRILFAVVGILFLSAAAFFFVKRDVTESGNETSRLAVVQSIVDNGTADISGSLFHTPDKAALDGRLYGDKPPLLTWLTTGYYFLLAKGFGLTFRTHYSAVIFLIGLVYFLISAGTGIACYYALTRYAGTFVSFPARAAAAALCVLSTLVFSYSVTINNHTPCAFLLMILLLQLQTAEKRSWPLRNAFLCGITTGLIFNCEFVLGGVFGLGVFVLCLTAEGIPRDRLRRGTAYAAGGLLLLVLEGLMNAAVHGSPLPLYLLTHKPDMTQKDYFAYAWNALFGFEGFFLYMPACLFLFPALLKKFPGKDRVCACMLLCCLFTAVLFLIVTSDYGGFCYGYRFLIPIAPVLLFYTILSFFVRRKKDLCTALFAAALLWGVVSSLVGTLNPWTSGYEGSPAKPGNFFENVRNGFASNAMVLFFDHAPESAVTRFFLEKVYSPEIALFYIYFEHLNRHEEDKAERARQYYREHYRERTASGE